ncbi:lysine transporter LysE [Bacillus mangrovi]|uniref:Lysine transporter LysE n=1 Tax=Metabacillus mangrovi TaxID=1491830 RepID=A0A7X2V6A0_9BACI|nr:LysE family transporter [Metabacillus mangrovi]MTH54868.1 lysine transporter LysE [Metabacillus mangrovi]
MSVVSFLLFAFVTSFTPGPNNIMAMAFANQYGFKRTFKFCLGVGAGCFLILLACSSFNMLLGTYLPKVEFFMTIIGSAYMLYLAFQILKSKPGSKNDSNPKNISFTAGMMLQFINPKLILYGITVISTFILPYYASPASFLFFSLFLAFLGFLATILWAFFGAVFQKFLQQYRMQFNVLMALLLMYSAVSILV